MKYEKLKEEQNQAAIEYFNNPTNENAEKVISMYHPYLMDMASKKSKLLKGLFSVDELYAEAREGVWVSLLSYSPEKGKFSSYFLYQVLSKMQRFIERNASPLNYGRCGYRRKLLKSYEPMYAKIEYQNPKWTRVEIEAEISRITECPIHLVQRMGVEKAGCVHLDYESVSVDNSAPMNQHDVIPDPCTTSIEDDLIEKIDREKARARLMEHLENLSERDRDVLENCILDDKPLRVVGDKWGVSREYVRQRRLVIKKKIEVLRHCQ